MELTPPPELLDDCPDELERRARVGKWVLMKHCGLPFGEKVMLKIARGETPGYQFRGAVSKAWNGRYGDQGGLSWADIELEAEYLEVYDDIWPTPQAA